MQCPNCLKPIIFLEQGKPRYDRRSSTWFEGDEYHYPEFSGVDWKGNDDGWRELVWPRHAKAKQLSPDIPQSIAGDYQEADMLLLFSPRASAALSRRCLERVLHEAGGATTDVLTKAIDEVVGSGRLPTALGSALQATKEIGNFAAHPRKDKATGELFDVEPGEAEWMLEILADLFNHFYVKPLENRRMVESLNEKLVRAGKKSIPL